MNREEFENWIRENSCRSTDNYYANGISYKFAEMRDGWTAVFEIDRGRYVPLIQAADRNHAESFCYLREPLTVPAQSLL